METFLLSPIVFLAFMLYKFIAWFDESLTRPVYGMGYMLKPDRYPFFPLPLHEKSPGNEVNSQDNHTSISMIYQCRRLDDATTRRLIKRHGSIATHEIK